MQHQVLVLYPFVQSACSPALIARGDYVKMFACCKLNTAPSATYPPIGVDDNASHRKLMLRR